MPSLELSVANLMELQIGSLSKEGDMQTTSFSHTPAEIGSQANFSDDGSVDTGKDHPEYLMTSSNEDLMMMATPHSAWYNQHMGGLTAAGHASPSTHSEYSSAGDSVELRERDQLEADGEDVDVTELDYGLIHSDIIQLKRDMVVWETHHLALESVAGLGFGIAVSGGMDNPHFKSGETSITISDVLKGGPADGIVQVNDRVLSINGVMLDGCIHSDAINLLRNSGNMADLLIKRKVYVASPHSRQEKNVVLLNQKGDYGLELGCKLYIRNVKPGTTSDLNGDICDGDFILKINNRETEGLTLSQAQRVIERSRGGKLRLTLERPPKPLPASSSTSQYESNLSLYENTRDRSSTVTSGYSSPGRLSTHGSLARLQAIDNSECETQYVTFTKEMCGSTGIELAGGNMTGIFICHVVCGGNAQATGAREGDQILKINGVSVSGLTRQEVSERLASLPSTVELLLTNNQSDYSHFFTNSDTLSGDEFYIRSNIYHSSRNAANQEPMLSLHPGDVFRVIDTLPEQNPGSWRAVRTGNDGNELELGIIPNKRTAQTLATKQCGGEGVNYKSMSNPNWMDIERDLQLGNSSTVYKSAYDRVSMKVADFPRPVVIYGALTSLCRDKLLSMYPAQFEVPEASRVRSGLRSKAMLTMSAIQCVVSKGKHCLLELSPHFTHRLLTKTDLHPIVIHVTSDTAQLTDSKTVNLISKGDEQAEMIEHNYPDLFSAKIMVTRGKNWLQQVSDVIAREQDKPVWLGGDNSAPDRLTIGDYLSLSSNLRKSRDSLYNSTQNIYTSSRQSVSSHYLLPPRARSHTLSHTSPSPSVRAHPSPLMMTRGRSSTNPEHLRVTQNISPVHKCVSNLRGGLSPPSQRVEKLSGSRTVRQAQMTRPSSTNKLQHTSQSTSHSSSQPDVRNSGFDNRAFINDESSARGPRESRLRSASTPVTSATNKMGSMRSTQTIKTDNRRSQSGIWFTDKSSES